MSRYAVAPPPPVEPGLLPPDDATDRYLSELARWRLRREHELRALDELTRSHPERTALEADLTSSMTLFHAVAQRHDLLLATWEDVHGGGGEREWVAQLIWGMLELPDGDAEALAVSLPDALRLSDVLAGSLRARVDPDGEADPGERLAGLEMDLERLRQVLAEHDGAAAHDLAGALDALDAQVAALHGQDEPAIADIGAAESALAAVDRELIVTAASHAHAHADRDQAQAERAHLVARGEAVRSLAQRVLNDLRPAPRLGIPDVTALGGVPEEDGALEAYVVNLERVGRALDQAHATYSAALAEYADLADRAERLAKTLAGCGAPTSVDLAGMLTAAKESLHTKPADIQRASALIAAQEAYLAQLRPDA
ncbi:hypothetical protein [Ornithinimicrobium avium]|uniref:Uncharacterized protein n=1 Tax=Ornithinimicrobium avium TaxID=2283195 RepID=A0A345NL05_9MICO|nr:hypothetical protein [Ornithinimicrobium avium]AXH95713.1 hypothetical protein DV701_05875 [Ornithinimicrobium avium]